VDIGVIGDFDAASVTHAATNAALAHAAASLHATVRVSWVATPSLEGDAAGHRLDAFDGIVCAPGSPYASLQGALAGIARARVMRRPFIGTCGGFQHVLLEYARNVLGIGDAAHQELTPAAAAPLIHRLQCSLAGQTRRVILHPDSLAARVYKSLDTLEQFRCQFGLNPQYRNALAHGALRVTGVDEAGDVRLVELDDHPFFIATLFVPQLSSSPAAPHPLVVGFVHAARRAARHSERTRQ